MAVYIAHAQVEQPIGESAFCGLLIALRGLFRRLLHAVSVVVAAAQEIPAPGKALLSRLAEQVRRLGCILLYALAQEIHYAQGAQTVGTPSPGSLRVQQDRLVHVLLHPIAELIAQPQKILCPGQALLGGKGEIVRSGGIVLFNAYAGIV